MDKNVAETIKEITRKHLEENNGILLGQSISAVGHVNGTVPECKNIIELPMCDVAGAYFAVGAALMGKRPILVIRFQDFLWLNGSAIVNYAAKTKVLSGRGTPIFIRALAQEGGGTGALHSGKLHSLFMHMPGVRVVAPVTPLEYKAVWDMFMNNDDPVICCEHRHNFKNDKEMQNEILARGADITLYGISQARFNIIKAAKMLEKEGIRCNIIHLLGLKPLVTAESGIWKNGKDTNTAALEMSTCGLVVDTGFQTCGAAESIAYRLMYETGKPVKALGLEDKSVCVSPGYENLTPSPEKIAEMARHTLQKVKHD